ncbi:MAG: hypothetical protein O8C63_10845 [Candidatus Methanoperedens sp.]|nr:hypothetical protein [Candidatus Methanoperedens sp.]
MKCHEEVLKATKKIVKSKGVNEFTPEEVINYMTDSEYEKSTIRAEIVSRCCINAPANHLVRYKYFERIGHGLYKIR